MGIKVLTPPAAEPVTLAVAKLHLRVDGADEDALVTSMITRAREECEHHLQRSIPPTVLALYVDRFPCGDLRLPLGPVTAIDSVRYVDPNGTLQTWPSANYILDDTQVEGVLRLAYNVTWPGTRPQPNAVIVQYQTGFATCPEAICGWILLRVGTLYRMREADSDKPATPHDFADRLLDEWRVYGV